MSSTSSSSAKTCSLNIVGDGAVGKSSIVAAFKADGFAAVYKQTIGIDFFEKNLAIRGDTTISLRIWDVGGQSINSKSLEKYVASSDVVFLVYDVTNPDSFSNLDDWLRQVKELSSAKYLYLVGNKIDMIRDRLITERQHEMFIAENHLSGGIYVSAKTGENLVRSFYDIASRVCGIPLTDYELAFYDKVVTAYVVKAGDDNEERNPWADEIEREDREAELQKSRPGHCNCTIS